METYDADADRSPTLALAIECEVDMSPLERAPCLMVHTSVDGPPKRWYAQVPLVPTSPLSLHAPAHEAPFGAAYAGQVTVEVPIPWPGRALPNDATVSFRLRTEMRGINGDESSYGYADVALGDVRLLDIAAWSRGALDRVAQPPGVTTDVLAYNVDGEITDPSLLCMLRRNGDGRVIKARVRVTCLSPERAAPMRFAPPTPYDVTYEIMGRFVEAAARRVQAAAPPRWRLGARPFRPAAEGVSVPYFVSPIGVPLPGEHFFANWTGRVPDAEECEPWLAGILRSALDEHLHRWGGGGGGGGSTNELEAHLTKVAFHVLDGMDHYDARFAEVARFLGRFLARTSNACIYHQDIVDVNGGQQHRQSCSFLGRMVDALRSGDGEDGFHSALKVVVENFGDPAFTGCGDCEDFAREMRRIYLCLVHNRTRFASALLRVLGRVCAELYVACGALCTVTSASIQGAPSRDPSKPPIIGSDDDAHTPTGAHMFLILLPTGYFYDRLPNDARRGPTLSSRAAMLGMAPAVVCEGTGHLDPLLLCDRFYHADDPRRAYAAEEEQATYNAALKEASAVMAHACGSDAMDFQAARTQEALRHDPRRRISPFYRLVTKLYPIGVEEAINGDADCAWELYPPPPPLPGSEDAVPPHYYRVLTPVYRRDDGRVYNGVDLLHILEKRGGIEFVPGTRPPPDDERIFLSAMRRLPPDAATKAPPPGVHDALQRSFAPFAEAVRKDASSDGDGVERPEDARWVSFFVPVTRVLEGDRGQPMESPRRVREQAMRMAHRLRHNRRTLAAFAVLEAFSLAVMHVRITVLVDSKSRPTW